MTHIPARQKVREQAEGMLAELEQSRPGSLALLRADALAELARWDHIDVVVQSHAVGDTTCELAGSYKVVNGRGRLTVVRSLTGRRDAFTALHELGHHLQRSTTHLATVLAKEPNGGRQLEEHACDEFAASVLLPEDLVSTHIGVRGPTAAAVAALAKTGAASRSACCVAASRRLVAPGHVLLLDDAGHVVFAASVGLPRPAKGSDQSRSNLVATALKRGQARIDDAQLVYRDGDWMGEELFGDAVRQGDYVFAVLTTDHLPWSGLAVRSSAAARVPTAGLWTCQGCAALFPSHIRCDRCHQPKCPDCSHCECAERRPVAVCRRCSMALSETERSRGLVEHTECW